MLLAGRREPSPGGDDQRCTDYLHYDCGWDTYFDSNPEPGEWLASHWNIGSGVNHFVGFGVAGQNTSPSAGFNFDCTGLACDFTDASSDADGSIASRAWDFGDGGSSTAEDPSHSFAAHGTYEVELTVTDDGGDATSFTRQVTVPSSPPPANDDFESSQALAGTSAAAAGTNEGATKQAGEPAHSLFPGGDGGASVWYRWTAPASGTAVVDTCGSDFDTLLAVYKSNDEITALPRVGSNDDANSAGCKQQSRVTFAAEAGVPYRIAVDGYDPVGTAANDPDTGAIDLGLALSVPSQPSSPSTTPSDTGGGGQIPAVPVTADDEDDGEGDPIEFASVALRRGVKLAERAGPRGSVHRYTLQVPKRVRDLRVKLDGKAGDLDLYLGDGPSPPTARHSCFPGEPDARESCRVRRPKKGRWFAMVENAGADADAEFTIEATYRR